MTVFVLFFVAVVGEAASDFSVLLFFKVRLLEGASKFGWLNGSGFE